MIGRLIWHDDPVHVPGPPYTFNRGDRVVVCKFAHAITLATVRYVSKKKLVLSNGSEWEPDGDRPLGAKRDVWLPFIRPRQYGDQLAFIRGAVMDELVPLINLPQYLTKEECGELLALARRAAKVIRQSQEREKKFRQPAKETA